VNFINLLLLIWVAYTDLRHQRVPQVWSATALTVGLVTALLSPDRWLHLTAGLLLLLYGLWAWKRAQRTGQVWGGGDTWTLTYLGLVFGPEVLLVILSGYALAVLVVWVTRRALRGTVPLAGILALVAIGALVMPVSLPALAEAILDASAPNAPPAVRVLPVSPLPTPTPDPVATLLTQQAAAHVTQVGLATDRRAQAVQAAVELENLAGQSPDPAQAAHFVQWAAALRCYANGTPQALAEITRLSRCAAEGHYDAACHNE